MERNTRNVVAHGPDPRAADTSFRTYESDIAINIQLIGSIRAVDRVENDVLPPGRRPRALLAIMAMACGEKVSRNTATELLWGRSSEKEGKQSLRTALSTLKAALNRVGPDVVCSDNDHLWIEKTRCRIDVDELFSRSANEALDGGILLRAGKGEVLKELFGTTPELDQWLHSERSRFEDRLISVLRADLERVKDSGASPEERAAAARRLIELDATNEGAVRDLMQSLWDSGDRPAAMRAFERFRDTLALELDTTPSRQTLSLYEAIRTARVTARPGTAPIGASSPADPRSPGMPPQRVAAAAPFADRPSIAVMPFVTLSLDPTIDLAAEGIVEDLIESLSRIPTFFVISRLSTRAFRSTALHPREIGERLGVRYLLSGSLRAAGDQWRLSTELTDTHAGGVLWRERFEDRLTNLFEVQDRISARVARSLSPALQRFELKRIRAKRPEDLASYELFLQGLNQMHNSSREIYERAGQSFAAATEKDPDYATAHAWKAYWHVLRVGQGWSTDRERDTALADAAAEQALACDGDDPMALSVSGHVTAYLHRDVDRAFDRFSRALAINPNAAPAWMWSGLTHAWHDEGELGVAETGRAIALTPFDPLMYVYYGNAGVAALVAGDYDRAIALSDKCREENRTYTSAYRVMAIAHDLAGRNAEARSIARRLLELEPNLTVTGFAQRYPGNSSAYVDTWCAALDRAGVPIR